MKEEKYMIPDGDEDLLADFENGEMEMDGGTKEDPLGEDSTRKEDTPVKEEEPSIDSRDEVKNKGKKISFMYPLLGFVVLLLAVLGYFVSGALSDLKKEQERKKVYHTSSPTTQLSGQGNSSTASASGEWGYVPPPTGQVKPKNKDTVNTAKKEHPSSAPNIKLNAENAPISKMPSKRTTISKKVVPTEYNDLSKDHVSYGDNGSVCELGLKYSLTSEYIPYVKGSSGIYTPANETMGWDEKGIKLSKKNIVLSVDSDKGYAEIEKGVFLPLELFSSCVAIR